MRFAVFFSLVLLGCSGSPTPADSGVVQPGCGNGTLETNEECEGFDVRGRNCASEGFVKGTLKCTAQCTVDASDCSSCGDEKLTGPEVCEPAVGTRSAIFPAGTSCETQVDAGAVGTLSCTSSCDRIITDDCTIPPPKPGIDEPCQFSTGCQSGLFCDLISTGPLVFRCRAHCEVAQLGTDGGCPSGRQCADAGIEVEGSACSGNDCPGDSVCRAGVCTKDVGICR